MTFSFGRIRTGQRSPRRGRRMVLGETEFDLTANIYAAGSVNEPLVPGGKTVPVAPSVRCDATMLDPAPMIHRER